MQFPANMKRRGFFTAAARYGVLAALGAMAAVTTRAPRPGQTCTGKSYCRVCGKLSSCGLPQAMSARQVIGG